MLLRKNFGYTVIELLTIIAIFSILSGLTLVAWRNYLPRYKLSREVDKIVENLKYAQQKTVTEQISYLISFNQAGNSFTLTRLIPDLSHPGNYISENIQTQYLDPEIRINGIYDLALPQIQFTAAGGVVDSGQIELKNSHNESRTIDIRPAGFINY